MYDDFDLKAALAVLVIVGVGLALLYLFFPSSRAQSTVPCLEQCAVDCAGRR